MKTPKPSAAIPVGSVAFKWNTKKKLIVVEACLYPIETEAGRRSFDALCERAGALATQAWRGGATLGQAREIAQQFNQNALSQADLQRLMPDVITGQKLRARSGHRSKDIQHQVNEDHSRILALARQLTIKHPQRRGLATLVRAHLAPPRLSVRQINRIIDESDMTF